MEEENKNKNEKSVVDKGVDLAKNEIKKQGKNLAQELVKKFITWAAPVLIWILVIILAAGVINMVAYLIQSFFTNLFSSDDPAAVASNEVENMIYIDDDGRYKLTEDFAGNILTRLEELYVNNELMGFEEEGMSKNRINKYIQTSMKTMLPDNGMSGNDVEGKVKIRRTLVDGDLKYMKYNDFESTYNRGDAETLLDNFTINSDFELCIVVQNGSTTYYDYDGNIMRGSSSGGGYEIKKIDYQKYIEGYATPFNFFISLHLVAQDTDFMDAILNKVTADEIVLTYVESEIYSKEEVTYSGTETIKTQTAEEVLYNGITYIMLISENETTNAINNSNISDIITPDPNYSKKETRAYSGSWNVTKANTWLIASEKEISEISSDEPSSEDTPIDKPSVERNPVPGTKISEDDKIYDRDVTEYVITKNITITSNSKNYVATDYEKELKVNEFAEFIKTYPRVKNNLTTAPNQLFYLLQQSESTQKFEQIMRYIMLQLTGKDYGVSEKALDYLFEDNQNYIAVSNISKNYIRKFEHSSPPPTNADGTCYIIEDDGAGHPTVGYGVDIENSGYKQLFIDNGYPINIGGEVPIEFVDSIEERIWNDKSSEIKSMTEGLNLTGYQMNALISRAYNCGSYGAVGIERGSPSLDFVESYRKYWNQERDSKFEEKDNTADFTHPLYTQYMSKPVTSDGKELLGLVRRRESEWTLFQTGYYKELNRWHTSGDGILQAANEVHKQQITWTYSVENDLYWNDIEKSLNNPNQVTCCAGYVACVIYKAGLFTEDQINSFENYNYCPTLYDDLKSAGWKEINNYDELEPGDIVFMSYDNSGALDHVQIYAGNDTWYNAGSTEAIQRSSPYNQGDWARTNFYIALRVN